MDNVMKKDHHDNDNDDGDYDMRSFCFFSRFHSVIILHGPLMQVFIRLDERLIDSLNGIFTAKNTVFLGRSS